MFFICVLFVGIRFLSQDSFVIDIAPLRRQQKYTNLYPGT